MLGYIIILSVIAFIIVYSISLDNFKYLFIPMYLVMGLLFGFIGAYVYDNITVDAIEVYRGNTTLEITYRDSIPVDSIVILKNK